MTTTALIAPAPVRPGIDIRMGDGAGAVVSPAWRLGGWSLQFVRLDAGQRHLLDQTAGAVHVKVVTGRLAEPDLGAYASPRVVRSTRVTGHEVVAGPVGAVFAVLTAGPATPSLVRSMDELHFEGPLAERLVWQRFDERFAGVTTFFDGLDCYMAPGFHLLDAAGDEIAYVMVWTAGKGVDLSTHNHGRPPSPTAPAFAEVHWVLHNGTGQGGMYVTPEPGSPERERTPMQQGEEHGPFFDLDPATARPVLRDNGAVSYPWHGWEAGPDDGAGQAYDVVAAFEIAAPYALVQP